MTLKELRAIVQTMKGNAAENARLYARVLGVDDAFTESIAAALGEISIEEAYDALEREALAGRRRLIDATRAGDVVN